MELIRSHWELVVYRLAFRASMEIYRLTKAYPEEQVYSLTSRIRRSFRSLCKYCRSIQEIIRRWLTEEYGGLFVQSI